MEAVVKAAASDAKLRINFNAVKATRGKVVRAEPVAAFYEQCKVHHVGAFPELEDQLAAFSTHGYLGDGSPDRADALIWGLTEIFPRVVSRGDSDWRTTRPHRDRPAFANVGYSLRRSACAGRGVALMTGDDAEPTEGAPADQRRRARLAQIEAEQEHGRQLLARYGGEQPCQRFAAVGHVHVKRRRR